VDSTSGSDARTERTVASDPDGHLNRPGISFQLPVRLVAFARRGASVRLEKDSETETAGF
jgi:hypothetical protein